MKTLSLRPGGKGWRKTLLLIFCTTSFVLASAQCGPTVPINSEDFESGWGIWNDGGSDVSLSSSNPNSGTQCVELRDDAGGTSTNTSMTTNSLDLSAYTGIEISFSYYPVSMDNSNEDFWLQISTDGGSNFTTIEEWNEGDEFVNDTRYNEVVTYSGALTSTTQIRFRCDASGNNDLVYIDDITIRAIPIAVTSFPYSEGFESGFGAWVDEVNDDFDWTSNSGSTPTSGTGPSSASEGSEYLYTEASNPNNPSKDAILNGPCFDLSSVSSPLFTFDYHMEGAEMGDLSFQASSDGGNTWTTHWTRSGDQGSAWNNATISLSAYGDSTISVRFYATTGSGSESDIAIDNINLDTGVNTAPTAVDDTDSTNVGTAITIDVLANDSDPESQPLTINAIVTAPNHGGTAVINDNGTPGDPSDDYIDFTPSGSYTGVETFSYEVCDNDSPALCDTATVSVTITACVDGSTAETSPDFTFGSEWKYYDTGDDLGTAWTATAYNDSCWAWGDAELGFGDGGETTLLNDHGGITYYFRKHFNVADKSALDHLLMELRRDDGAVVYFNGTEVYRSNMPTGTVTYTTAATAAQSGSDETDIHAIVVPASVLADGNNVIAVEIHQSVMADGDLSFDLQLSSQAISTDSILIATGEYWNYHDGGSDLGTAWSTTAIAETADEWQAGQAELGYGDGDEVTVVGYGPDPNDKYVTTYFRRYFSVYDFAASDSLEINLRKDDGAVVYINGTEVYRSGMPTGTINYDTYANFTASGGDETNFYTTRILANVLQSGTNVIAVEIHQVNATSSDISFELQLELHPGDPDNFVVEYDQLSGVVYLDADVSRDFNTGDYGQGAIGVWAYQDLDADGEIDPATDPRLFSDLTNPGGTYEITVYKPNVQSVKSDISNGSDDAVQDGDAGEVSLSGLTLNSIRTSASPSLCFDSLSTWKYYDTGGITDTTWTDISYNDASWSSGSAVLGFGDPVSTTITSGELTYYFRMSFNRTAAEASANQLNLLLMRDDGAVVYLNGDEIYRTNMPAGPITPTTLASSAIGGADELQYIPVTIPIAGFEVGTNVIAVEIHQVNGTSSDVTFDMRLTASTTYEDEVGYRFRQVNVPKDAIIVDAHIRLIAAETSEDTVTIQIYGEAVDDAAIFQTTANNISSRAHTTATAVWSNTHPFVQYREIQVDGLEDVVQEIVDRPGWSTGNDMAFFLSGHDLPFYSFEGGFAAELTISYGDTAQTSIQYVLGIDDEDMPAYFRYLGDPTPSATISEGARAVGGLDIGYVGSTSMCVATSDDGYDGLHIINRFSGKNKLIGPTGTGMEIEAIALSAEADTLYAVDADEFGFINLNTGTFTGYGSTIGTGSGAAGDINLNDVDGLAYDIGRGVMWATHRRTGGAYDLIFVINTSTGQFVPDVFGPGIDYVVLSGDGTLPDIDDISVNPNTGNLFGMNNDNGGVTNLIEINVATGAVDTISNTGLNDMEGQGFHNDGLFYSTSGREGIPKNSFYQVDTASANLIFIGFFLSEGDFEGCDCKSGPKVNFFDGTVFNDTNEDGVLDAGDAGEPNVTVYIYQDMDGDSIITAADSLIATVETDSNGYFLGAIPMTGYFIAFTDTTDLPAGAEFTTPPMMSARFGGNGEVDYSNNFGFRIGSPLPIELISFTGERKDAVHHLYWSTASETNNDYFEIQRSSDAVGFEVIGQVKGAGNSASIREYEFVDDAPLKGINYYRLRQVDYDGASETSRIIDLKNTLKDVPVMTVAPNPTAGPVRVSLEQVAAELSSTLKIYDIAGTVVEEHTLSAGKQVIDLDLSGLQKGIYMIELWNDAHRLNQKVILR